MTARGVAGLRDRAPVLADRPERETRDARRPDRQGVDRQLFLHALPRHLSAADGEHGPAPRRPYGCAGSPPGLCHDRSGADTPAVLSEYADRYGADPARWLLLTGEKEAIYRLARSGGGAVRRSIGPRGYRRGENAPGGARSIGPMPGGSPIRSSPSAQGSGRTYRSSGQRGAHPTLS